MMQSDNFDPGPPPDWENLYRQAPLRAYINHPSNRFHCTFGPVFYRGRLDGTARVLIIGQAPSVDDVFARRAWIGQSGQQMQGFLRKMGITRSYVMINTFLYGVRGPFDRALRRIALETAICEYRNIILDNILRTNALEAVIAVGEAAQTAVEHWDDLQYFGVPVFSVTHPSARGQNVSQVLGNWQRALDDLRVVVRPEVDVDAPPYRDDITPDDILRIPRGDLPFGVPDWLGTGGTHGTRTRPNRIAWTAPQSFS